MIQAYRRGLLRPDYPHGERSRLRESVLLDSLEMESLYGLAESRLRMTATIASGADMDGQGRKQLLRKLSQDLRYYDMIRDLAFDKAEEYRYLNSELALAKAYEILEREGLMTPETEEPTEEEA